MRLVFCYLKNQCQSSRKNLSKLAIYIRRSKRLDYYKQNLLSKIEGFLDGIENNEYFDKIQVYKELNNLHG